jgi:hypothetical protein
MCVVCVPANIPGVIERASVLPGAEMARGPLEVDLPVCPVCGRVGKIANPPPNLKSCCSGPLKEGHQITKMEIRTFREVVSDGDRTTPDDH